MNAILQCLAHVQSLTIYLLERSNEILINLPHINIMLGIDEDGN